MGKSIISLVLSQIAAQNNLKVLAIDLDEQRHLAETLELSSPLFLTIDVRFELKNEFAEEDYDFYVIDTHPSKNKTVINALKFADIVLVPVMGDYYNVINLHSVYDYIYNSGVGTEQVVLVKNCIGNSLSTKEIDEVINEHNYFVASELTRSSVLLNNISSGNAWNTSMRVSHSNRFIVLYDSIWNAYREMLKGNFSNLWPRRHARYII